MSRLLHHHDRLFARPNRRHLRRLLDRAVPADGRKGQIDRRVLVQTEIEDVFVCVVGNVRGGGGVEGTVKGGEVDAVFRVTMTLSVYKRLSNPKNKQGRIEDGSSPGRLFCIVIPDIFALDKKSWV